MFSRSTRRSAPSDLDKRLEHFKKKLRTALHVDNLVAAVGRMCFADAKMVGSRNSVKTAFHFMKLPAELRLEIYEYVFQNLIDDMSWRDSPKMDKMLRKGQAVKLSSQHRIALCHQTLAMFHTNRIMRAESFGVCYRLLTASIDFSEVDDDHPPLWLCFRAQHVHQGFLSGRQAQTKTNDGFLANAYLVRVQRQWVMRLSLSKVRDGTAHRPRDVKGCMTLKEQQEFYSAVRKLNQWRKQEIWQVVRESSAERREVGDLTVVDLNDMSLHDQQRLLGIVRGQ